MPLLVRGGGGGKNTKDATAVPGDVRSGKTFYGANGKQTGIWTPKVTDYTGDATAVPEDVRSGRIFYNNLGRQIGVRDSKDLYYVQMQAEKNTTNNGSVSMEIYTLATITVYLARHSFNYITEEFNRSYSFNYYSKQIIQNTNKAVAIEIDGHYLPLLDYKYIDGDVKNTIIRIQISGSNGGHSYVYIINRNNSLEVYLKAENTYNGSFTDNCSFKIHYF